MTSEKGCRKDKNQNIQVFVRLRPLNQRERDIKSLGVVEVVNGREVVVRQSQQSLHTKRFTFDRAFPPHSKQVEIYQEVVSPLIEEVLAGYNCTVFAYGQTGTGKTHTMVGEAAPDESTWQTDPLAGIIPRALSQLFDELRISNTEYTVRVSYLELYNEELFDLLSTSEDNSKLRIYEDVTRKGANIVNGLEEITVYNKKEVFKIMAQGQERKRVASTLMNAQSSRSHTVFTIVVHMKENSPEGEELVKIGKLNLVDLAGSENISKAGSDNPAKRERARECVNINQSLLTLGRVITALVERHPHIPYRESKLTRILQESLGGRTKTSIIATVSPGHKDLEETMSTLEYANRAKNIQNKPEINQKMTKKAILKEYAEEIDKLKRDLHAARERNGVYLANETFAEMTLKEEEQRKEIQELLLKKRAMEEERDRMESVFKELSTQLEKNQEQLSKTADILCLTENKLANTINVLETTKFHYEEQKYLVGKHAETESVLSTQAKQLLAVAEAASTDASKLLESVDKRKSVESTNLEVTKTYREVATQHRNNIVTGTDHAVASILKGLTDIQTCLESYTEANLQTNSNIKQKLDSLVQNSMDTMSRISSLKATVQDETTKVTEQHTAQFREVLERKTESMESVLERFSACVVACLQRAGTQDLTTTVSDFLQKWQQNASHNVTSLRDTQAAFETSMRTAAESLHDAARRQRRDIHAMCERLEDDFRYNIATVKDDEEKTKQDLEYQVLEIEREKEEFETMFTKRAEEERRLLEERLQRQWETEKSSFDCRILKKLNIIEEQKTYFEKRTSKTVDWLNEKLRYYQEEIEKCREDYSQNEKKLDAYMSVYSDFVDQCHKGFNAITSNVDSLAGDAVCVVDKVKEDLVSDLQLAQTKIQDESSTLKQDNQRSMSQLAEDSDKMLRELVQQYHRSVDTLVGEVNGITTTTIEDLSAISAGTAEMASSCHAHRNQQKLTVKATHQEIVQLYENLMDKVKRLEELETRCLNQEYAVYNPSGSTPVRTEYKYPRTLAATSPHERILSRFRAMRQNTNEDDCILIENDVEGRSDTESTASEDSAIAAASPTDNRIQHVSNHNHSTTNHNHSASNHYLYSNNHNYGAQIVKCTSETDIYLRRRQQEQQGKENSSTSLSRNVSFKKPSKLPAPSSHKKPLHERNADN